VTAFVIVSAAMLAAVVLWLALPLLRPKADIDVAASRSERRATTVVLALIVPVLAAGLYAGLSNWDWQKTEADQAAVADMEDMLKKLEDKLASEPNDVTGWLLLGRSYAALGRYPRAAEAYQRAYDLTNGESVEAVTGLGEALALTDQASLAGRAGQLFEAALAREPNNPKALWYGSMSALQLGDLRRGRDRLQQLLSLGPPDALRTVLERQIQDLDQQLGEAGEAPSAGAESGSESQSQQRRIRVAVTLSPQIQQQLGQPMALFVLARRPEGSGPPLAVKRLSSSDIPVTVELSESDAMIAGMNIASTPKVQVVARLSKSGTPQAQSGDFYGEADYEFGKDGGTLNIMIDRTVP
jgi:cytochrome c-type biogenesis protein CcmH